MNEKLLAPIGGGDIAAADFTGLVFALFNWFMLGAATLVVFVTKLSRSMLMPAPLHVEPIAIGFFWGSVEGLLLVVLELNEVLDGRRMSSPGEREKMKKKISFQSSLNAQHMFAET